MLRFAHNQPTGHPYDEAARRFAAGVEAATGGTVLVKVYPSSQLGDTVEQLEGLLLGTVDFSIAATAFASEFVPEFGLFSAPFLFEDVDHFGAVFDGETGAMLDSLAKDRAGIRLVGMLSTGDRIFFNSRRAVEDISDLNGLIVRVMPGKADAMTWSSFGAIPTPMAYSELYSALQAGVIDGAENDPASILSNRFFEACPYLSITNHLVLPLGIFSGEPTRRRVSEAAWRTILEEAHKTSIWQRNYMDQRNREALQTMQTDFGVTVSYPERVAFTEKAQALQDQIADEVGAGDLLEHIRRAQRTR